MPEIPFMLKLKGTSPEWPAKPFSGRENRLLVKVRTFVYRADILKNFLMKKIALLSLFVCLFAFTACEAVDDSTNPETSADTESIFVLVEDGDRSEGDYYDIYSGTAVVSGEYSYRAEDPFFALSFFLDDESVDLVPQGELFNRQFTFENYNEAKDTLLGSATHDVEECDVNIGQATIQIDGYNVNLVESATIDSTALLEVIENSGPTCAFD